MNKYNKKKACPERSRRGFTLIEVLVAAAILVMLIGAAVTLDTLSIRTSSRNRNQTEAVGLAQEGLNAVQSIVDNNQLNDKKAFMDIENADGTDKCKTSSCKVVESSGKWSVDSSSGLERITINGVEFTREIKITDYN